jgi:hypothetical protein
MATYLGYTYFERQQLLADCREACRLPAQFGGVERMNMDNQQLIEVCDHLLKLAHATPGHATCAVCDCSQTARFVHLGDDEFACEDCVKQRAALVLEHAKCSVS